MNAKKLCKITVIVCPDRFGIHEMAVDGVYVRYVILSDEDGKSIFIDDPNYETVKEILYTNVGVAATHELHDCLWCQARAKSS